MLGDSKFCLCSRTRTNANDVSMISHVANILPKNWWYVTITCFIWWSLSNTVLLRTILPNSFTICADNYPKRIRYAASNHGIEEIQVEFSVHAIRGRFDQWIDHVCSIIGKRILIDSASFTLGLIPSRIPKISVFNWKCAMQRCSQISKQPTWISRRKLSAYVECFDALPTLCSLLVCLTSDAKRYSQLYSVQTGLRHYKKSIGHECLRGRCSAQRPTWFDARESYCWCWSEWTSYGSLI